MRHRVCSLALGLALSTLSLSAPAAGLDDAAPAKKVTVRSELVRGNSAASDCGRKNAFHWLEFNQCIDELVGHEQLQNTDTDAFLLGAYFFSLVNLRMIRDIKSSLVMPTDSPAYTSAEANYRTQVTQLKASLKLTDQQVAEATQMDYNYVKTYLQ